MELLELVAITEIDDSFVKLEDCIEHTSDCDYAGYAVCVKRENIVALSQTCGRADSTITPENIATAIERGYISICVDQICKAFQCESLTAYLAATKRPSQIPMSHQDDTPPLFNADFDLLDEQNEVVDDISAPTEPISGDHYSEENYAEIFDNNETMMKLDETLITIKNQIKELNEAVKNNAVLLEKLKPESTSLDQNTALQCFDSVRGDIAAIAKQISESSTNKSSQGEENSFAKLSYELTRDVAHKLGVKARDDSIVMTEEDIITFVNQLNLLSPVSIKEIVLSALLKMRSRDERKIVTGLSIALLNELAEGEIER